MNNQSNNEIIKATRKFRDVMTADTAIIEIAKMLSGSADRLDVTTAALREMTKQRDAKDVIIQQLAAENVALKSWAENRAASDDSFEQEQYSALKIDWRQRQLKNLQTPATDAALAEIRAQGVDEVAAVYRQFAQEDGCSCNMQSSYNLTAERAERVAVYIRRKGAAV